MIIVDTALKKREAEGRPIRGGHYRSRLYVSRPGESYRAYEARNATGRGF